MATNYVDWQYIVQIINNTEENDILSADIYKLNISKIPNISDIEVCDSEIKSLTEDFLGID